MSALTARALAGRAGVLAPALAAFVAMMLAVGVPAVAAAGRDGALRQWADGEGRDAVVTVQIRAQSPTPNPSAEAAIVAAAEPVPVLTRHVFATAPLPAQWDGGEGDLVLAALRPGDGPDFLDPRSGREALGGIASGRMPTAAGEAIVDAQTAERRSLDLGDIVQIGDRAGIEIVGIWSPSVAGVRLLRNVGLDRGGVFSTVDEVFTGDSAPYERWLLELDPTALGAGALVGDQTIVQRITDALAADGIPTAGIVIDDRLSAELEALAAGADAAERILAGVTVVGAAIGLIALAQIGGMIATARSAELRVLRARGASRRRIALSAGAVVGAAALVGALAAALLIALAALAGLAVIHPATVLGAPVVIAAVAAVAVGRACVSTADPDRRRSVLARAARPLALIAVVVVAVLAVVGVWTESAPGVLTIAAPALALVASVALLLVAARPLARALASGRVRSAVSLVAARRIARRPQRFAPALVIIAMQIGIVVLAATTAGSAEAISAQARALDAGAAVRAVGPGVGSTADVGGAGVLTDRVEWGAQTLSLVAITSAGAAATIQPVTDLVDPGGIAAALGEPAGAANPIGLPLGDGPLDVVAPATGPVALWFVDESGTLLHRLGDGSTTPIALPSGTDWRLLAVDGSPDATGQWRLDRIAVDDDPVDLTGWMVAAERTAASGVTASAEPSGDGIAITATLDSAGLAVAPDRSVLRKPVRLVPADSAEVPAVVDAAVADAGGLAVGDPITARFAGSGRQVTAVVADVVPAIPGTGTTGGIMLDLRSMLAEQLRVSETVPVLDERWFGATDAVAATAIDWPDDVTVRTAAAGVHDRLVATAIAAAWGSAALALVLAAIALIAAVAQRVRLDRPEVRALRAMGLPPAGVPAGWRRELAPLAAGASVVGLLAGLAAAAATVPMVTWRAVPVPPVLLDPVLRVDPVGLLLALIAVAAVIAAVVAGGARAAGRSAVASRAEGP